MNLLTRATGYLSGFTSKFWLAVCAGLILLLPLAYCKGRSDEASAERARQAEAQLEEERKARLQDEKAAKRRAADKIVNDAMDDARKEAIENAPDDETDAAGRALACQRLRAAGIDTPAACVGR